MVKTFNVEGACYPCENYMVDISKKLEKIKAMIDSRKYFTINRARQFGKTTTLQALEEYISDEYIVISISFEGVSSEAFKDESKFCNMFARNFLMAIEENDIDGIPEDAINDLKIVQNLEEVPEGIERISKIISNLCKLSLKPVVLMIDEVDKCSNNQLFLDFLGMLRNMYLKRIKRPTFQSVILAGVYDIKSLKIKIRQDGEQKYNSPWNIAADFFIDMSFSKEEIKTMLKSYEEDYHTGMDIDYISSLIYDYTSGYPYLVSRICKIIDEYLQEYEEFKDRKSAWTYSGFQKAIKIITTSENLLFHDMNKKLSENKELNSLVKNILIRGKEYAFAVGNETFLLGIRFGILVKNESKIAISNRIFEIYLYDKYISENQMQEDFSDLYIDKNKFINKDKLNMELILNKFQEHFIAEYKEKDKKFLEDNARFLFLTFLRPIINGIGNYYIEARTRNQRRTDVIVDYKGNQYIIELKIWHGEEYNERGKKQLFDYLNYYKQNIGYLVSFNFNKNKEYVFKQIEYEGKHILEVVI